MSAITEADTRYFERLFNMSSGYVLDYSDRTFENFFDSYKINIHSKKYQTIGTSKANKLRAFWKQEPDALVGKILLGMLDLYEADCEIDKKDINTFTLKKARDIATRLSGGSIPKDDKKDIDELLAREFTIPNIDNLPIDPHIIPIIKIRLKEAEIAFKAGAHLSVIFLCGSTLEGILLGAANKNPIPFNQSKASPKDDDDKVRPFHKWNLAQFIDVACEIGVLKLDVKKFSHELRDFRNYIHPYQQMSSGFTPDKHTATVCLQVLKMALASVAGER